MTQNHESVVNHSYQCYQSQSVPSLVSVTDQDTIDSLKYDSQHH